MLEQMTEMLYQILPQTKQADITMDTRLVEDLGLSSLHMMLMALALEDTFHVHIAEDVNFQTVGDVCQYLENPSMGDE